MTLHIVDVSRHQVERPDPLDLEDARNAGMGAVNLQLDRGRQDDVLPDWARVYADHARDLGLGISTYRWLDNRIPGEESAFRAFDRMVSLGGPVGMAHVVDCEDTATEQQLRDYVTTMSRLLGRPVGIYSGRWWLQPKGWTVTDLSPYLWASPSSGYLTAYPGDDSPHWTVSYGGYTSLAAMQYAVTPLPGTGNCSLSAIRDPRIWAVLTGGHVPLKPDKHITPEHARFINEVQKLEPADTGDLYPYVRQAGYHGSRDDQIALGRTNDYSIRSADDKAGPSDKTAAFDWISESARLHGDHTIMYRYGRRIRDAYNARDPRLKGWREWLTYLDGKLIGFDFVGWYTRTPDSSHGMHHHLSKLRRYTTDWTSYAGMLSILAGEPLATWTSGRSRYQEGDDMLADERNWLENIYNAIFKGGVSMGTPVADKVNDYSQGNALVDLVQHTLTTADALAAAQAASAQREQDLAAALAALGEAVKAVSGSVDVSAVLARIDERTADVTGRIAELEAALAEARRKLAEALA